MTLANDICRCLGLLPAPDGVQRCTKRDECARYVQRHTGGDRTPMAQWMCPTANDYFGMFIAETQQ
jgi:hypothetical protein